MIVDHSITGRVKHAPAESKIAVFVVFDDDMNCHRIIGAFDSTIASRTIISALNTEQPIPLVIQNMMHIDGKRFGKPKIQFTEYLGSFHKDSIKNMKAVVKRSAEEEE